MTRYTQILLICAMVAGFGLATAAVTTAAHAQSDGFDPLREDETIHQGLTVISIGRLIRNHCPTLDAKRLQSFAFAQRLVNRGHALGFSRAQMEAYVDSDTDRDRYRAIANTYLSQRGASVNEPESVCQLGRDEISSGSAIGRLLREV